MSGMMSNEEFRGALANASKEEPRGDVVLVGLAEKCDELFDLMADTARAYNRTARKYRDIVDQYGDAGEKAVRERMPMVPDKTWRRLLALARGDIHPSLVFAPYPAAPKLERLPVDVQRRAIEEGVELRTESGVVRVPVSELSGPDANRAFCPTGIIPPDQQRPPRRRHRPRAGVTVLGRVLEVTGTIRLTREDLERYLEQIQ